MSISKEAKKSRAEYMREWRKRNPDKVSENNARYWEKKARKQREELKEGENNGGDCTIQKG